MKNTTIMQVTLAAAFTFNLSGCALREQLKQSGPNARYEAKMRWSQPNMPTLEEAQTRCDNAAENKRWSLSPAYQKKFEAAIISVGSRRPSSSQQELSMVSVICSTFRIPPSESLLSYDIQGNGVSDLSSDRVSLAFTDQAVYLLSSEETLWKEKSVLRIPYMALTKVDAKFEESAFDSNHLCIKLGGQVIIDAAENLHPRKWLMMLIHGDGGKLARIINICVEYNKLNTLNSAQSTELQSPYAGQKGVKWEASYDEAKKIINPTMGLGYIEFDASRDNWNIREGDPRSFYWKISPREKFSTYGIPIKPEVRGFRYNDIIKGVHEYVFIDNKFYALIITPEKDYNGPRNADKFYFQGNPVLKSMISKYGLCRVEINKDRSSLFRYIWDKNEESTICLQTEQPVAYEERRIYFVDQTSDQSDLLLSSLSSVQFQYSVDGVWKSNLLASHTLFEPYNKHSKRGIIPDDLVVETLNAKDGMVFVIIKVLGDLYPGASGSSRNVSNTLSKDDYAKFQLTDGQGNTYSSHRILTHERAGILVFEVPQGASGFILNSPSKQRIALDNSDNDWINMGVVDPETLDDEIDILEILYYSRKVKGYVEEKIKVEEMENNLKLQQKNEIRQTIIDQL